MTIKLRTPDTDLIEEELLENVIRRITCIITILSKVTRDKNNSRTVCTVKRRYRKT